MGNPVTNRYTNIAWPAPADVVAFSTTRDCALPITPNEPIWLNQVHGAAVVRADAAGVQAAADAAYTAKRDTVCVIETADCLPLLICNKAGTEVAAIHAGWRSLAAGVITNTFAALSSVPQDCLVWLGPAIGPQKFEVHRDVLDAFAGYGWDVNHGFTPFGDKWLVDLYALARRNLQQIGVVAQDIYGGGLCTYSDPQTFYSYRRAKEAGRMVHLIWLRGT